MDSSERGHADARPTYLSRGRDDFLFPRDRTALLVIDPVNDFLSQGGVGYPMTSSTLKLHHVVEHLEEAIDGARARGIPVLYGPMAFTEEDYAHEELQRRSAINRFMFEQRMFLAGSWGADFHPDLRPREGDLVLLPHKGIDVFETDLPRHLERLGITHLVIAGMTANLCCESTGRHAMEKGYDVTFLSDAIGAINIPSYEMAVHLNYPMIANAVMRVDEFLAALDASLEERVAAREGDTVRGSDHGEVGVIEQVVLATGNTRPHLVVPRRVFHSDLYIPLDAVVRRAGSSVFINVPKRVVARMPWTQPPTVEEVAAKQGPSEESVRRLYGSRSPSVLE
jgi:ureidoacrylate peracid hydrolase